MDSEEDSSLQEERKFIIKTDRENEMDLFLRIYNNEEFEISIYTKNEYPTRKFQLKCYLDDFLVNRFFKIFLNTYEIMLELENKIEKSKIIEDANYLILIIPIGLTVINEITIELKEIEKTKDEQIEELNEELKYIYKKNE